MGTKHLIAGEPEIRRIQSLVARRRAAGDLPLRVLSLGAGVQSSTLALMAAAGEIPVPDCAVFADTGWEPAAVYTWLDWMVGALPFPVFVVSNGNIRNDLMRSSLRAVKTSTVRNVSPPLFTVIDEEWTVRLWQGEWLNEESWKALEVQRAQSGLLPPVEDASRVEHREGRGMVRRQCTEEYKIRPLRKMHRHLLGYEANKHIPIGSVEVQIGISIDEASRMKPSRDKWAVNVWPLIDARMNRDDCRAWLGRNVPPEAPVVSRSACIGCPFHSDREWLSLAPSELEDACVVDDALRSGAGWSNNMRDEVFLHPQRVPLREVEFDTGPPGQFDLFPNECEGMCGV